MRQPELSREYLVTHYLDLGKTRYQIEEETGVSATRIGSLLQKYGIRRRTVNRHGLVQHPLNAVWCGIKERCYNPNADNYCWYGGRGINVCDEWQSFMPFYNWAISNGWERGLTVDRIDSNGDYTPDNCRLVTHQAQCRNRRTNAYITVDGVTMLQCEWEEALGLRKKIIAKWKYRHGIDYVVDKLRQEINRNVS